MALIYWMPQFNTNITIIDQQHHILVDLINELGAAREKNADRRELLRIIDKIGMLTASHFGREEHLFETHGYPDMEEHLQEHDYFEDMLYQFADEFKAGKQELTTTVLTFLSDWLVSHITGPDREYVAFLGARGVS